MSEALEDLQRARIALERRDLHGAYHAAHAALRAAPRNTESHAVLGTVLSEMSDLSSGEWHLRRALELGPPQAHHLVNLAVNLIRQGRTDEADACFAEADRLSPRNLEVLAQWSKLQELRGELDRAEALLERATAASSARDVELLRVTYLARRGRYDEALAALDGARALSGDAQLERGRILDRLGRHDEAWRDWVEAKAKLAAESGAEYPRDYIEGYVAALENFFVRARVELLPRASVRADTPQPVFIVGLPRSGTTLIEHVLAGHSAVRRGGELTFVGEWRPLVDRLLPGTARYPANLVQTFSADGHHAASLLRDYYLARAEARGLTAPDKRLFTDKMPLNELHLPLVRMAFPDAKVVRVVRHPLDVCVSMLSHQLTHGFNCGSRVESIVHLMALMHRLTAHYMHELDGGADVTLRYEDFVRNPEDATGRLLHALGLDFEPGCLALRERPDYAATPSYAQVTQPLNEQAIGRHRHYLAHLEPYIEPLVPWLETFGYEIDGRSPAAAAAR